MVDIRIMASPKRAEHVKEMLRELKLPETSVTWDNRPNGGDAMYTAKKAWLHPVPSGVKHRLILQDDIEMCDNFVETVNTIADAHSDCVLSLFSLSSPNYSPYRKKSPYHQIDTLNGCAIMMPTDIIEPCMKWCDESTDEVLRLQDDLMITEYCKAHKIMMLTTFPNIVQHIGNESLLNKDRFWECKSMYYDKKGAADWYNDRIIRNYRLTY